VAGWPKSGGVGYRSPRLGLQPSAPENPKTLPCNMCCAVLCPLSVPLAAPGEQSVCKQDCTTPVDGGPSAGGGTNQIE
jgi:hypothetical protein